MAEAIAAVALAGNVLQFLEAGGKFAARAFAILRRGGHAGSSDLSDLRQICGDFEGLLEKLRGDEVKRQDNSSPLVSLSIGCSVVVEELLGKLNRIGSSSSHYRVDLLLEEFRSTWQKREIQELESRIARFRDQLAAHLVIILRCVTSQRKGEAQARVSNR